MPLAGWWIRGIHNQVEGTEEEREGVVARLIEKNGLSISLKSDLESSGSIGWVIFRIV